MSVQTQFMEEHEVTLDKMTPGVELVLPTAADDAVLDVAALRLVGVLQRRMWDRRRDMLQRRAMNSMTAVPDPLNPIELDQPVVVDMLDAPNWDARLQLLRSCEDALSSDQQLIVRTRSWESFEAGVLVDSRSAIGPVFDVAIVAAAAVDSLRSGNQPFVLLIPEPKDAAEAKLWRELITLTEDRLGIDRGMIQYTSHITAP